MHSKMATRDNWMPVRFGDVVTNVADSAIPPKEAAKTYIGLEHMDSTSFAIRRWGSDVPLEVPKTRVRAGDVLFARRNTHLRRCAIAPFDTFFSPDGYALRTSSDDLLQDYLLCVVASDAFMDFAVRHSAGTHSKRVRWTQLANYQFALPPVEEQQLAAGLLRQAMSTETSLDELRTAATTLRDSCRDSLCGLPSESHCVRLDSVCTMQNGKAFPGNEYCGEGVRLLRPGNLAADGTLTWEASRTTHLPLSWMNDAKAYVVNPGDVLINLTAQSLEEGFMGRVCMAGAGDQCLLNQRIGRFVVDETRILPEFLFRCLQTSRFKMHAIANCEGSKVKHLFWSHLAKFEVPLPTLCEQSRTVGRLAATDMACRSVIARQQVAFGMRRTVLTQVA